MENTEWPSSPIQVIEFGAAVAVVLGLIFGIIAVLFSLEAL